MAHSTRAKVIQRQYGTPTAARYLKIMGFDLSLAMFILTGAWPR